MLSELDLKIMKEQLNRLAYIIDEHPYLSGLMTNEYLGYVKDIASLFDLLPLQPPNFELDLYEDDPFAALEEEKLHEQG